jgi:hypothetical protein
MIGRSLHGILSAAVQASRVYGIKPSKLGALLASALNGILDVSPAIRKFRAVISVLPTIRPQQKGAIVRYRHLYP